MGLTIAPLMIAVQSSVPFHQRGQATSLAQFSRSLGGTLGVGAISTLLATGMSEEVTRLSAERNLEPIRTSALTRDLDAVVRDSAKLAVTPKSWPTACATSSFASASLYASWKVERGVLRDALAGSLRVAFLVATCAGVVFFFTTLLVPPLPKGGGEVSSPP
jgi:hypothetical protein